MNPNSLVPPAVLILVCASGCSDVHHEPAHDPHYVVVHDQHHDRVVMAQPPPPPKQPPSYATGPGHWVWDPQRNEHLWVQD